MFGSSLLIDSYSGGAAFNRTQSSTSMVVGVFSHIFRKFFGLGRSMIFFAKKMWICFFVNKFWILFRQQIVDFLFVLSDLEIGWKKKQLKQNEQSIERLFHAKTYTDHAKACKGYVQNAAISNLVLIDVSSRHFVHSKLDFTTFFFAVLNFILRTPIFVWF